MPCPMMKALTMTITLATWNVNSVRARLDNITGWLQDHRPDVVLLQEIKCINDQFPASAFEDLGYNIAVHGQKSYNGVAILSRQPIDDIVTRLPGNDDDEQARYLEVWTGGVRVVCVYVPNGNPIKDEHGNRHEKFAWKLAWQERLRDRIAELLQQDEPLVIGGDFNIIPTELDAKNPKAWLDDALFQPESRAFYRSLCHMGLVDIFRHQHADQPGHYSFWDYQAGALQRDHGIRIDYFLLSPQACDRFKTSWIDKNPRTLEKASDHTPVLITLE